MTTLTDFIYMSHRLLLLLFTCIQASLATTAAEFPDTKNSLTNSVIVSISITNLLTPKELDEIKSVSTKWERLSFSKVFESQHSLATNGTSLIVTRVLTNKVVEEVIYNNGEPTSLRCKHPSGSGFDASFFSGRLRDFTQYNQFKTANIDFILRFDERGRPVHFARFSNGGMTMQLYQTAGNGLLNPTVQRNLTNSGLHIYNYLTNRAPRK